MTYKFSRTFETNVEQPADMTDDEFNAEMARYQDELKTVYEWARDRMEYRMQNGKEMREFNCTVKIL